MLRGCEFNELFGVVNAKLSRDVFQANNDFLSSRPCTGSPVRGHKRLSERLIKRLCLRFANSPAMLKKSDADIRRR